MKKNLIMPVVLLSLVLFVACDVVDGMIGNINEGNITVTYYPNSATSGSVPVNNTFYNQGDSVAASGNTGNLLKINVGGTSYRMAGWNTQSNGGGTTYLVGESVPVGSTDISLHALWIPYALRDVGPAGGYIFYDKGSYSGSPSWRYMEAAPSDQGTAVWGTSGTTISGADGVGMGTGYQNTIDIVTGDPLSNTSADICSNLTLGGYSDWFLPSHDELLDMYSNLKAGYNIGGFSSLYWSSTENDSTHAYIVDFLGGTFTSNLKNDTQKYRAVREF